MDVIRCNSGFAGLRSVGTGLPLPDRAAGALWDLFVGDALAMHVHLGLLRKGWITYKRNGAEKSCYLLQNHFPKTAMRRFM